ncbi:MAG: hypothetical protein WCD63_15705, partial [Terrimicrobiaceae bacterium]
MELNLTQLRLGVSKAPEYPSFSRHYPVATCRHPMFVCRTPKRRFPMDNFVDSQITDRFKSG